MRFGFRAFHYELMHYFRFFADAHAFKNLNLRLVHLYMTNDFLNLSKQRKKLKVFSSQIFYMETVLTKSMLFMEKLVKSESLYFYILIMNLNLLSSFL